MGVMNNLRQNTGVVLWILVFSFGVIWVLQDSQAFDAIGAQPRDIAVVNGESVSFQEYQQTREQLLDQVRQQTGGDLSQAQREQVEARAYDQLVTQTLLEQEMDRLGVMVTDDEILDLVYGENPHPLIRRQFADSTGQINYQLLNNFAENPEAREQWAQIEEFMRQQRRQQKMNNILQATVHVSDADVRRFYERQNESVDIEYVLKRYATVPTNQVEVTDAGLQSYYNGNKDDFKRKKTYTIEYVSQPKVATEQDTTLIREDLRRLRSEFESAEDDSTFLQINASTQPLSEEYKTPGNMPAEVASAIYEDLTVGRVAGPVFAGSAGHLLKIRDVRPSDDTYVRAQHILLRLGDAADGETTAQVRERIEAIQDSIQSGADFAEMARRHSADGSASQGGDLGWFSSGRMVPPFEQAAFNAAPGNVVGPIRTEFGFHLIKVNQKATQAVQYADMAYSLDPSPATLNDFQAQLEDIAYYTEDGGSFREEAQSAGYEVQTVQVEEESRTIPGIGRSAALMRFLSEANEGEISNVFELDDKFVLARVDGILEEGFRPFEDVKAEIRPRVLNEKRKAIVVSEMENAFDGSSLSGLATELSTRVRTKDDLTFEARSIPGLGNDPEVIGVAFGLDTGETSPVMAAESAAYVLRVTDRNEVTEIPESERQQIRRQLLAREQQQVAQQFIESLRNDAEITDNRSRLLN